MLPYGQGMQRKGNERTGGYVAKEGTTILILDSFCKWGNKESSSFMVKLLDLPAHQVLHRAGSIIPKVLQCKIRSTQPRAFCWGAPCPPGMQSEPLPPSPPSSKLLCDRPSASLAHASTPGDSSLSEHRVALEVG